MKKNRRNNSRPAAIATAKDTTKAIETRAGVLKEAEDVKKEAKTSFYLQYMGKEISTEEITKKVHEVWTKEYGKCGRNQNSERISETRRSCSLLCNK